MNVYIYGPRYISERMQNIEFVFVYGDKVLYFYVDKGYGDQDVAKWWSDIPPNTPVLNTKGDVVEKGSIIDIITAFRHYYP